MNVAYIYLIVLAIVLIAFVYILANYFKIKRMREGTRRMREMAAAIRSGANQFMKTEYKTITIVVLIVALVFSLFIEVTSGISFIIGAAMSSAVCILGMRSATYANVRTANTANTTRSIGESVKVALCGGSISGLSVQAFGMLGMIIVFLIWGIDPNAKGGGLLVNLECNPTIMHITTYSLGCSLVAMFNRVAGGNYTKAADISSDILAKNRHDFPEDDPRVPNVVADFIGDNVNDIAGNCSDLLESFVATMAAPILISVTSFLSDKVPDGTFGPMITYPIAFAGVGLIGCLLGLGYAAIKKMGDNPAKELDLSTWISAGALIVLGFIVTMIWFSDRELPTNFRIGWFSPWVSAVCGIASGIAIGKITGWYTSADYKHTKGIAEMATEGEAFVVTEGDAVGSRSCLIPSVVIGVVLFASGFLCGGTYGIAIAALGMLGTVGAIVSIDAFGPIADNAGGMAEACELDEDVRVITDKLDSVGNTTAAIGKGFAIGSAAFATVSLIVAYVGSYTAIGSEPILNIASYIVIAGAIIGGALIEFFSALLTKNTIDSAKVMADVGDEMLTPGVIAGTEKPDYNKMIELAAGQALRKMLVPSLMALIIPVIGGFIFGVQFVGGLLIGATIVAIPRAIFMGNSGGAFDNAKKYIESGAIKGHGKGTAAHKASVTGDTIGDTRKDVVGVALDIFIKMMSTVANTLAPVISKFTIIK